MHEFSHDQDPLLTDMIGEADIIGEHEVLHVIACNGTPDNPDFVPTSYVGSKANIVYDLDGDERIVKVRNEKQLIGVVEGVVTRTRRMPEDEAKCQQAVRKLAAKTFKDYVRHMEAQKEQTRKGFFSRILRAV